MGRIKMLYVGAFFCLMSSMQALVFEIPIFPGVEAVVASDPGLKLGLPFLGGTFKHTVTVGGLYSDVKYVFNASSKMVIDVCVQGKIFRDGLNKKLAVFAAVFLKQPVLEKKLQEFYVLKQQLKKCLKNDSCSFEDKRRYIVLKHEIKALIAK